jgi:hypothetical protein
MNRAQRTLLGLASIVIITTASNMQNTPDIGVQSARRTCRTRSEVSQKERPS